MMKELTAKDGHTFECWIEKAQAPRKGGLVILQEIFGVTDQLKGVARHYASLGYDVAIPALFDRQQRGAVIPFAEGPKGRDLMLAAKPEETLADIEASVADLAAEGGKVGVMGFCWGGGLAIRAAQKLDIGCAIAFYGTRLPQYLDSPLKVPVQGHYGTSDTHVPKEMLDEARTYFDGFEVFEYDAGHAFANDARPNEYVEAAAEEAHRRSAEFLDQNLA